MAVKGQKTTPVEEVPVASQVAPEETQDTNGAASEGEAQASPKKRRGGPKGPRGPRKEFSNEQQAALVAVLSAPYPAGSIRTANSVHAALVNLPVFEGEGLTPAKVTAYVARATHQLEAAILKGATGKDGAPLVVPAWLKLDTNKVTPVDLSLFQ